MLVCRPSFRVSGIKVHPFNWHMPIVDMKQWEAHIPGVQGTPWEGGVYTLQLIFWHGIPEGVPIFRFIRPLFHLHTYPTGTWAREEYDVVEGISRHAIWKKTKLEDPERLVTLLRRIQKQLNEPDTKNPHQYDAYILMKDDPAAYKKKIREQAEDWKPDPQTGLAGRRILQPVLQD
ncbi:ubiquitin-conjugating enzyme/RWD-like protein [Mycena crocata]|nr:ubiquitin-conjugating enzyme/RWD-like protein [Mycena crocata]